MSIAKLETLIGYSFKDPDLLWRAITHRSWAHENFKGEPPEMVRSQENESFEFIGDSVLGLAIAEQLYNKHPDAPEGELTLMKHRLVSTQTLATLAEGLKLGEFVRIGHGEERSGGRAKPAILADTLEAVIGAVFFDSGYIAARAMVARIFADELRSVTAVGSVDYKTLLQERLQGQKLAAPVYKLLRAEGPPHERTFYVSARWEGGSAAGEGRSIKAAEMMAASEALKLIQGDRTKRTTAG